MRKIISESPKKNIRMVVYHNTNSGGVRDSITRFESIDSSKPVYRRAFKKYLQ